MCCYYDSGADTRALRLKYGHVGVEGPAINTCYVDAQGALLAVQSTRLANVQFGDVTSRRGSLFQTLHVHSCHLEVFCALDGTSCTLVDNPIW